MEAEAAGSGAEDGEAVGEEGGMESAEAKIRKSPPYSRLNTVNVLGN
jgi:hypothetical protein